MHKCWNLFVLSVVALAVLSALSFAMDDGHVRIISTPVTTGLVGQPYTYDVDAQSDDSTATITYSLHDRPDGMTIDGSTGLIEWTPVHSGSFRVEVRAGVQSFSDGGGAEQEFSVRVISGAAGAIEGTVRDSLGQGIPRVSVRALRGHNDEFSLRSKTDSLGHYLIAGLDPGVYFLPALPREHSGFEEQWFDGVRHFEDATPVTVPESTTVTADFVLFPDDDHEVLANLFGNVSDSTGAPIAGARVAVFKSHSLHTDKIDEMDDHGDGEVRVVATDSSGNYHVLLRKRGYLLRAKKDGFTTQWWDHQATRATAGTLFLAGDTSGIDFDLSPAAIAPSGSSAPEAARLRPNYPNPFNPSTAIRFVIPAQGRVRLVVYNTLGQSVATLVDQAMDAGEHQAEWNAGTAASGVYFYRLEYGGALSVGRMLLIR